VEDGLDVVAIGIEDERGVVGGVVVGRRPWSATFRIHVVDHRPPWWADSGAANPLARRGASAAASARLDGT
jgi:hypothetical protein